VPSYRQLNYIAGIVPPLAAVPSRMTIASDIEGDNVRILYRGADDGLFWDEDPAALFWGTDAAPLWAGGDFVPWPGSIQVTGRQLIQLQVIAGAGDRRGVIHALSASFDVP
jgi:hypothetical protein